MITWLQQLLLSLFLLFEILTRPPCEAQHVKNAWLLFVSTDLQDRLNLGRDISLLVQLDALLVGPGRALCSDALQVGQHHAVSLCHCLELVKQ